MSAEIVKAELIRFLQNSEPTFICVTGKWGVGKTYLWNDAIAAAANGSAHWKDYSYVSLFGRRSIDEVRLAIFENTRPVGQLETEPSNQIAKANGLFSRKAALAAPYLLEKALGSSEKTQWMGITAAALNQIIGSTVRNQLICIDDLERAGAEISAKDVLGLVEQLKDQKKCSVVLLLNEDALEGDNERQFRQQLERVAKKVIRLEPTTAECINIVIADNALYKSGIAESCFKLGIVNIRTIQRIDSFCRDVEGLIGDVHPKVIKQMANSLTLYAYSKFQPDDGPSFKFIQENPEWPAFYKRSEEGDPHGDDKALLKAYGVGSRDAFDAALLDGVALGSFSAPRLIEASKELTARFEEQDRSIAFHRAFGLIDESFDDNSEEVVDALRTVLLESPDVVSADSFATILMLLRRLGHEDYVEEVSNVFFQQERESPFFWNVRSLNIDEDILQKFAVHRVSVTQQLDPKDALLQIADKDAWSSETLDAASTLSVDDLVSLFKELRGHELRRAVQGALKGRLFSNKSEPMSSIAVRGEEALERIALEGPLNEYRVQRLLGRKLGVSPSALGDGSGPNE